MDEKVELGETIGINIPLQSPDGGETKMDENPPPYENPRVDFSSGWKDRGFAIAFWIHTAIVIILALVFGVPALSSHIKVIGDLSTTALNGTSKTLFNIQMKPIVLGLSSASAVAGLSSLIIFFLLQQCTSHFIKFSFLIVIMTQILAGVVLFFAYWPLCFIPGTYLSIILIFFCCLRKRISFAEAHLKAGCAALRSHLSLIPITIIMLIVEFIWFIFWFLMVLGIHRMGTDPISSLQVNTNETMSHTTAFNATNTKLMWMTTTPFNNEKSKTSNNTIYSMRESKTIYERNASMKIFSEKVNSTSNDKWYTDYVSNTVRFILLLSWYWGAITFGNIGHFITACIVGQWWFDDGDSQQYSVRKSIKRAFTTSFGTIACGSLLEALIKAFRRSSENTNRNNRSIFACIIGCILQLIEKLIRYLNEWAFIFAALTGQGFVQASKSFIELFKKRGWTAIINDTLIGTTLVIINLGIAIMSAVAGGLTVYFISDEPLEKLPAIIILVSASFIIGLLMSSIITSIITSCVRTVFVCFALNPAALGATHPDHLQNLSKVWHKFYPQEFASSGYANQFQHTID